MPSMLPTNINEKTFDNIVSKVFERIYVILDNQPYNYDLNEKNNVLSYKVPGVGEYVINKQPPNRQIWVSSPITGPKRFNLGLNDSFYNNRDKEDLIEYVKKEVETIKKMAQK